MNNKETVYKKFDNGLQFKLDYSLHVFSWQFGEPNSQGMLFSFSHYSLE